MIEAGLDKRLYLVRHVETASNALGYYPPRDEHPSGHLLSHSVEELRQNAREVSCTVTAAGQSVLILTSESVRAKLTAGVIAAELSPWSPLDFEIHVSEDHSMLNERDLGDRYGLPKYPSEEPEHVKRKAIRQCGQNALTLLEHVLNETPYTTVIAVTHSGPIRGFLELTTGIYPPAPKHGHFIEVTL